MSTPEVERLRELIRFPTVSRNDDIGVDWDAFAGFQSHLQLAFPRLHAVLEREVVGGHSLLYRWVGSTHGAASVLMAHQDVVPADEPGWRHPPFDAESDGTGDDERVWGRGAIDDKGALGAILEAVERRVTAGFRPECDIYLAFGHDEETAGSGAPSIVELLRSRGIRPGFVLDEGGAVVTDVLPGVDDPIALIGVSEKGLAGVELIVEKSGGHASTPATDGATTRLARAILKLEKHPSRAALSQPTIAMLQAASSHARAPYRFLFARARTFRRLLARVFVRLGPESAAVVRTTRAVTRLSGSAGDNVIAERATAMVNVRITVGSTVDEAVRDIRAAIDDDEVAVRVVYGSDPSPVSPSSGPAWDRLATVIGEVFSGAVAVPYVMLQASDSRHFSAISENVYRFLPFDLSAGERAALHAIDESIRVSTYLRGIDFFDALIGRL